MGFVRVTRLVLLCGVAAVLASCGGGKSTKSTSPTPASITVTPTSLSLNHGDVVSIGIAQVLDSTGAALSSQPTFTYSSSSPSFVTVSSGGQVCAGVFDANNIVCQVEADNGSVPTANIIVSGDGLTATVPIYVHARVDAIKITSLSSPVCLSQNQTQQFSAQAFSNGTDITSKVGPFSWSTGNASLATADQNGVVTSRQPGLTTVVASVTSTTGTPQQVIDCPPKTISLTVSGATTNTASFNSATGTSQTLVATVTDILGQPITSASLVYSSYVPSVATVTSSGTVSTPGAGTTAIVASCSPPSCNPASGNVNANGTGVGLPVYSNPVIGTVTGSTAATVYVTGADNPDGSANTSLIPIAISSNTAGTAITLQGSPNSMVFNRAGTTAYIGTNNVNPTVGMLIFDAASNTVTAAAAGLTGKVLTVSNDGSEVVLSDIANGKVFVYNASANTSQEFDVPGVTAADFDSDNSKAYLTAGTNVYEFSATTATFKPLTLAADGVVFTPQASVAYLGGSSIMGIAVCNDARVDSAAGAANILRATPDGTHVIGAGAAGWVDLSDTINNSPGGSATACPPSASNTLRTAGFGAAFVGTPTQIAVASNTSYAFLTSFTGGSLATGVPFYHFADGTTGTFPFTGSGGTLFSGSMTQDAVALYVGVGANGGTGPQVHRIDLTPATGPADTNQINVTFNPRIVVVRPQ